MNLGGVWLVGLCSQAIHSWLLSFRLLSLHFFSLLCLCLLGGVESEVVGGI